MLGLFGKSFKIIKEAVGFFGGTKEFLRGKRGGFDISRLLVLLTFGLLAQEYEQVGLNYKVISLLGALFSFIALYKWIETKTPPKEKKDE